MKWYLACIVFRLILPSIWDHIDVKVLFLIKDVRTFTISHLDLAKRKGLHYKYRIPAYHFFNWYYKNREVQNFLRKEQIPYLQIGYEELCLYTNQIIQKLYDFLGEKQESSMVSLKDSGSHAIRANRMLGQPEKHQGIFYDHRWFYRKEWLLWALLFPNIMRFNQREVYTNGTEKIWTQ